MTLNLDDLIVADDEAPDPDCTHPVTAKKFSGSEICSNCSAFLGYWSEVPLKYSAMQNPDGTFTINSPDKS